MKRMNKLLTIKKKLMMQFCVNQNSNQMKPFKNLIKMKKITLSILFCISGLLFVNTSNAQTGNATELLGNKGKLVEDTVNSFISFSPVFVDGKTYVRWLVKNDKKDGLFVVERSEDGVDFEALGFKDRIGTQLLVNLFYSYVDEAPFPGETLYRVMQVGSDNTYKYSDVVKVKTDLTASQSGNSAAVPAKGKK